MFAGWLASKAGTSPPQNLLASLQSIMPAMLRNGLENGLLPGRGKTPLSDSLTSSLEVKLLTILRKEGGCEDSWLCPWLGFWQPAMWFLVPIPFWLTHTTPVWALPSQLKSDYYCPLSIVYKRGFNLRCGCILGGDSPKVCLFLPSLLVYIYYWMFKFEIL